MPDRRLGADIINGLLGALTSKREGPVIYLGTDIYPELEKAGFGNSDSWTERASRDKKWLLATCESDHWMAINIDWKSASIEYYDPQCLSDVTERMHTEMTTVSRSRVLNVHEWTSLSHFLQVLKAWVQHLDGTTRVWRCTRAHGPRQTHDDVSNSGVYTTAVLISWSVGMSIGSSPSPDTLRAEFVEFILEAIREERVRVV